MAKHLYSLTPHVDHGMRVIACHINRTYGPPYHPNALSEASDEVRRGAIFLFISANAMAPIEFVQQEWIING